MRGTKKNPYRDDLCGKMYRYFLDYEDRGLPSFSKFAKTVGLVREDIERFRKHKRFEAAYRECQEIRRDYLIDRALDKRFDGSFAKFLLSAEESEDKEDNLTLLLKVTE